VSGLMLVELRSMQGAGHEWPRRRSGGLKDERLWVKSLDDQALARLAGELGSVERVVRDYRRKHPKKDAA
jgi:hypothetical protein